MTQRWYVVQAFSGFENSVKRSLEERVERAGLSEKFGEILVPTEEVVEIRGGQKRRSERKFFPGYVLVRMELDDETWHLVKEVPRVMVLSVVRLTGLHRFPIRKLIRYFNEYRKVLRNPGRKSCLKWVRLSE